MAQLRYMFFLLFVVTSIFANSIKKHILVLHSYNASMSWEKNIDKAIDDILQPNKNGYILHREYMDTKRIFSKEYIAKLKELYTLKYKNIHFNIILSSDNNAFDFLRAYRNELFGKDVPVIFCGVNDFHPDMLRGIVNFTGAAELFDAKRTIQVAKKLIPDLKNIFVVNDYLVTGRAWSDNIKKQLKDFDLNITYAPNLSMSQLQDMIASLPPHSTTLLGVFFKDKAGNYFTYERAGMLLSKKATQPIFSLLRFNIGNGIVGGSVIGGYSQGEAMAKMAKRVLSGEKVSHIPVLEKGVTKLIFDYPSLMRYHLDRDRLPKEAIVLNEPLSFYQRYKDVLWIFASIVFLLGIIIFMQTRAIKKQKLSEKLLKNSDEQIKKLYEQLKQENIETQNLFRTFFENLPIPLFYKNKNGIYLGTNKKFDEMYGFEEGYLIGKSAFDIAPKELAKKYKKRDDMLLRNPDHIQIYESSIKNFKNSQIHNVVFHKTCFFDAQDRVQGIIGAILDITKLKEQEKDLQIANKRSELIIDNIMEGVIMHNTKKCVEANAKALEIYGITKNDLLKKSPFDLVSPNDHEKIRLSMQEDFPKPYEITAVKADGNMVPVLIKPFRLINETKQNLRIVSIIDLTDTKEKERALIEAKNRAEVAAKTKAQFLANMSHELRTPLNGILGMLYAVSKKIQDPYMLEKIEKINHSAKSLLQLINNILDYSKLDTKKLHLDIGSFNICELICEVKDLISAVVYEKGIDFIVENSLQEQNKCYVRGDIFRIKQILFNLLGNAVKFTDKGYVKLFFDRIDKDFVKIVVSDTGIGIDDVAQKVIFDSFVQADLSINKKYQGSGLGLSISKDLVELMDGKISLTSKKGEGTQVEVVLKLPQIETYNEEQKQHIIKTPIYLRGEVDKEQKNKRDMLPLEIKKECIKQLSIFAKQHQARDIKNVLREIFRYKLTKEDEELFLMIYELVEKREYKEILGHIK